MNVMLDICFDEVDFGNGVRQSDELLSVRWPGGVYLKLRKTWTYHLSIERNDCMLRHQTFRKPDAQLLLWVKRWAKDISSGRYDTKKTKQELLWDIVIKRDLASFMNDTKWHEFRTAMQKEMPFAPPYEYKTLFDEDNEMLQEYAVYLTNKDGPHSFGSYDEESFCFSQYKTIEWIKIRPRFFIEEGDALVKKKVWYDCEKELVEVLKNYSIPYESENGIYTIYGYK